MTRVAGAVAAPPRPEHAGERARRPGGAGAPGSDQREYAPPKQLAPSGGAAATAEAAKVPAEQAASGDAHIARQAALRDAAEFGMIGLLNSGAGGDPNAPTAPVGARRLARQRSDERARQHVGRRDRRGVRRGRPRPLAASARAAAGAARASASARSARSATAPAPAPGRASAPGTAASAARTRPAPPQVRMGATSVSGRLPPEVIQRIVRQNFGRFRLCYENGLRNNPNLQGRVAVRFVIGRDGAVSNVAQRRLGSARTAASSPASCAPSTACRSRSPRAASSPSSTRSCSRPAGGDHRDAAATEGEGRGRDEGEAAKSRRPCFDRRRARTSRRCGGAAACRSRSASACGASGSPSWRQRERGRARLPARARPARRRRGASEQAALADARRDAHAPGRVALWRVMSRTSAPPTRSTAACSRA